MSAAQARRRPARGRHSIWELALHIAYWDYAVRRRLSGGTGPRFPRSPANWPRLPKRADESAWAADRELLRDEQRALIAVIERFPSTRLDRRVARGKRYSFRDLMLGILVHDAYHAGQIQMLKRLVRSA